MSCLTHTQVGYMQHCVLSVSHTQVGCRQHCVVSVSHPGRLHATLCLFCLTPRQATSWWRFCLTHSDRLYNILNIVLLLSHTASFCLKRPTTRPTSVSHGQTRGQFLSHTARQFLPHTASSCLTRLISNFCLTRPVPASRGQFLPHAANL